MDCTDTQMVLIMDPSQSEDQLFDRSNDDEDPLADPLALPEIKAEPLGIMPVVKQEIDNVEPPNQSLNTDEYSNSQQDMQHESNFVEVHMPAVKQEIDNVEPANQVGNAHELSNSQQDMQHASNFIEVHMPAVKLEIDNVEPANQVGNAHEFSNSQQDMQHGSNFITCSDSNTSNTYEENLDVDGQVSNRVLYNITESNPAKNNVHTSWQDIQEKTDIINKGLSVSNNQTSEFENLSTVNKTSVNPVVDTARTEPLLIKEEHDNRSYSKELTSSQIVHQTNTPTTDLFVVTKNELSLEETAVNSDIRWSNNRETHSDLDKSYICIICSEKFSNSKQLNAHIITHTSESEPLYCPVCYKAFSKKNCLLNHLCLHTGFWPLYCYWCGKGFIRKSGLRIHLHEHEEIYQKTCPVCKTSFMNGREFEDHILNSHGFEDSELTSETTRIASSNSNPGFGESSFQNEMMPDANGLLKRTENGRYTGTPSEKNPILRAAITGEIQKETSKRKHQEGSISTMENNENRQMQIDTTRTNNLCTICSDNFNNTHDLNTHLLSHSSQFAPFACPICKKLYNRKYYLFKHLCWHTGHLYYSCTECGKGLPLEAKKRKIAQDRAKERKEESKKPKTIQNRSNFCKICKETFTSQYYYKSHMLNNHTGMIPSAMLAVPQIQQQHVSPESLALPQERSISLVPFAGGIPRPTKENEDLLSPLLTGKQQLHIPNPFVIQSLDASSLGINSQQQIGFLCPICKVIFTERNDLNGHLLTHTSAVSPFVCPLCQILFADIPKLENHLLLHSGIHPLGCHICGQSFPNSFSLLEHHREHAGIHVYACHLCSMKFSQNQQLLEHIAAHKIQNSGLQGNDVGVPPTSNYEIYQIPESTDLNIQIMNCESLNTSSNTENIPKDACSEVPSESTFDEPASEEPTYKIQIMDCESLSTSVDSTNVSIDTDPHEKAEESDEETNIGLLEEEQILCYTLIFKEDSPQFSCNICNETFASRKELTKNIISHSFNENPFHCPVCNKGLSSETRLKLHICLHTEYQPYICHICQTAFSQKKALKCHYDNIHQHTNSCELCNTSWSNEVLDCEELPQAADRESVDPAVKEGTQVLSVKPTYEPCFSEFVNDGVKCYSCNFCNDSFTELKDVTKHLGMQHTSKSSPFACPSCNKTIKSKFNLFRHLCLHTGYRPFSCYICNKPFIGRPSYVNHLHMHAQEAAKSQQNGANSNTSKDVQNNEMDESSNNQTSNDIHESNTSESNTQSIPMKETVPENQMEKNQSESENNSNTSAVTVTSKNSEEQATPIVLDDDSTDDPILISSTSSFTSMTRCNNKSAGNTNRARHVHICKRYSCRICKKSFAYESTFKMHMREKHGMESEIERDPIAIDEAMPSNSCQPRMQMVRYRKITSSVSTGDGDIFMMGKKEWKTCFTEIVTIDTNTRSYSCNYCNEILPRKLRVSHLSTHSSQSKPFPCPVCYETFQSKFTLDKHIFEHTNINPYECHTCGKFFKKTEFKGHLCDEVERQFVCRKCKQSFSTETPLRKHTYFLHIKNDPEGLAKSESGVSKVLNENSSRKESSKPETNIQDTVSNVETTEVSVTALLQEPNLHSDEELNISQEKAIDGEETFSDKIEALQTTPLKDLDPLSDEIPENDAQEGNSVENKIPDKNMDQELLELSEAPISDEIPENDAQDGNSVENKIPDKNMDQELLELSEAPLSDEIPENDAEDGNSVENKIPDKNMDQELLELSEAPLSDEIPENDAEDGNSVENKIPDKNMDQELLELSEAPMSDKIPENDAQDGNSVENKIPDKNMDQELLELSEAPLSDEIPENDAQDGNSVENKIPDKNMDQDLLELSETPLFDEIPEISTQCGSSDVTKNVPEENVDYETSELSETHLKEVDVEPTVPLCGALLNKSLDNRRKLLNDKAHFNTEISAQTQLKDLDSLHNENRNPDDVMEHEPSEILETTSLKDESSLTDNMPTLSLDNSSQMERFNNGPIPKEIVDHTSTEISGTTPLSDVDSLSNEKKDLSLDVSSQKESVEYKTTIPDEIVLKSGISSDKLAQMETVDVDNTSSIVDVKDELVEMPDSTDLMEADPLCNDSITIQNELMEQETTEMQSTINLQETVFPSSKKIISSNDST